MRQAIMQSTSYSAVHVTATATPSPTYLQYQCSVQGHSMCQAVHSVVHLAPKATVTVQHTDKFPGCRAVRGVLQGVEQSVDFSSHMCSQPCLRTAEKRQQQQQQQQQRHHYRPTRIRSVLPLDTLGRSPPPTHTLIFLGLRL